MNKITQIRRAAWAREIQADRLEREAYRLQDEANEAWVREGKEAHARLWAASESRFRGAAAARRKAKGLRQQYAEMRGFHRPRYHTPLRERR